MNLPNRPLGCPVPTPIGVWDGGTLPTGTNGVDQGGTGGAKTLQLSSGNRHSREISACASFEHFLSGVPFADGGERLTTGIEEAQSTSPEIGFEVPRPTPNFSADPDC